MVCVIKVFIFQFYMEILILVRRFSEELREIYDSVLTQENTPMEIWYFDIHFFYISNPVAKAPGLKLGKKLNNFLNNREASN